jgi:hypothetical protein
MKNIYLLKSYDEYGDNIYKIGLTKRKVEDRVKELKTGNANDIEIIDVYEAKDYAHSIESSLHRYFQFQNKNGEWFYLNDEDISKFQYLCEITYNNFDTLKENSYINSRNIKFK